MRKPYGLVADVHCHAWSAFSRIEEDGVNSRLRIILDELLRVAQEIADLGGDKLVIAGDLFHVRGSVKPSVMNPTAETFQKISEMGITVEAIAGNHDLEGSDATALGNAMQTLGSIENFHPITSPKVDDDCVYFPWYASLDDLRDAMTGIAPELRKTRDAIIHAPLNGVIKGLPDIGLTPEELSAMGYRRVFVGHFHNHVEFEHGKVFSIGATTHQTWSDPGSLAGFMVVHPDHVEQHLSRAPSFIDLKRPEDIDVLNVKGNYVRLKLTDVTEAEIKDFRNELEGMGALGVSINATRRTEANRTASISAGATLEVSVAEFIDKQVDEDYREDIQKLAASIMMEARSK